MKKMNKIISMFALAFLFLFGISCQSNAMTQRKVQLDLRKYTTDTGNSQEGWVWNVATKTLTLANVDFDVAGTYPAIMLPDESTTIILSGNNKIKGHGLYAIATPHDASKNALNTLTIKGMYDNSSLDLTSKEVGIGYTGDVFLQSVDLVFHANKCFESVKNLTMDQINLTAARLDGKTNIAFEDSLINVWVLSNTEKASIKLNGCYIQEGGCVFQLSPAASYIGREYNMGSAKIKIVKGNPSAVKIPKAEIKKFQKNYTNMTIYWCAPNYSDGVFEVYRSTKKSSGFKKIATTKLPKYTDKKLKFNKTYYYKIKAKNVASYSFSAVKSTKTGLASCAGARFEYLGSKDSICWKKVYGASGYKIYRASSKNGKYSIVATVKKGSQTSKSITRPKKSGYYYYKIQAYRKQGKKYYYSGKVAVADFIY